MPASLDERAPLLQFPGSSTQLTIDQDPPSQPLLDAYGQFCYLVGNRPKDHPQNKSYYPPKDSLYHRAVEHRKSQGRMYAFTSALTNTLLLTQVVLGAALTGMGASNSPGWLITVFGAMNTIIAGLVAFLKSRGQPMRARMFRDDLERVVDEIENSATMWRGISQGIHGYDAIDTDEAVTVRSEVARLTRLYDRAVKTNTINDPDYYGGAGISSDPSNSGLRSRPGQPAYVAAPAPATAPVVSEPPAPAPVAAPAADPDESPATKAPSTTPPKQDTPAPASTDDGAVEAGKSVEQPSESAPDSSSAVPTNAAESGSTSTDVPSTPAVAPTPAAAATVADPDESPASAARPPGAGRAKSNKQTTKVTEDLSQESGQAVGGAAKAS